MGTHLFGSPCTLKKTNNHAYGLGSALLFIMTFCAPRNPNSEVNKVVNQQANDVKILFTWDGNWQTCLRSSCQKTTL